MKYLLPLLSVFILHTLCFAQKKKEPAAMTPALQQKIWQEADKEALALKKNLLAKKKDTVEIEFTVDTFRIEKVEAKSNAIDFSLNGLCDAADEKVNSYDSLLNNYGERILPLLDENAKEAFIQTQNAWQEYFDKELKFIKATANPAGGFYKFLISFRKRELVKERAIAVFYHYARIKEND